MKAITRLEILKQVRKEYRPEAIIGFELNEILEAMRRYADVVFENNIKTPYNLSSEL